MEGHYLQAVVSSRQHPKAQSKVPTEPMCHTSSLFTDTLDCEEKRLQILITVKKESDLFPVTGQRQNPFT